MQNLFTLLSQNVFLSNKNVLEILMENKRLLRQHRNTEFQAQAVFPSLKKRIRSFETARRMTQSHIQFQQYHFQAAIYRLKIVEREMHETHV